MPIGLYILDEYSGKCVQIQVSFWVNGLCALFDCNIRTEIGQTQYIWSYEFLNYQSEIFLKPSFVDIVQQILTLRLLSLNIKY